MVTPKTPNSVIPTKLLVGISILLLHGSPRRTDNRPTATQFHSALSNPLSAIPNSGFSKVQIPKQVRDDGLNSTGGRYGSNTCIHETLDLRPETRFVGLFYLQLKTCNLELIFHSFQPPICYHRPRFLENPDPGSSPG